MSETGLVHTFQHSGGFLMLFFRLKTVTVFAFLLLFCSKGFAAEDQPAFDSIALDIQAGVKSLEYPDEVGQDLVKFVKDWKCVKWKQKLTQAKTDLEEKKITADQAAQFEEEVAKELFETIGKEIAKEENPGQYHDLAKVLKDKKADSGGYAQVFAILGKSLGLSVNLLYALEPATDSDTSRRHMNLGVGLSDGKTVAVDLACRSLSKPFVLKEEFTEDGVYWEAKDKNLLGIHSRIQAWNENGLLTMLYNFRGTEAGRSRKYAEALAHFTKAISLNPNYVKVYANRGAIYSQLGEHAAALADTAKAIELDPKSAEAYCCRGRANFLAKKREAALSDFNKAIELSPQSSLAYAYRASFYSQSGQYAEALADATKAVELDPKSAQVYYVRGLVNLHKGNYTEALPDFDKTLEVNPKFAAAYSGRSTVYYRQGQYAKAISECDKAIELSPQDFQLYYNRAGANYRLGKFEESVADYGKAIELNPKDMEAYFGRGAVYHHLGKYNEALADYNKALEISPKDARLYFNRGLTHANQGNTEAAKKDLLKAVELDPSMKKKAVQISDRYGLDLFPVL